MKNFHPGSEVMSLVGVAAQSPSRERGTCWPQIDAQNIVVLDSAFIWSCRPIENINQCSGKPHFRNGKAGCPKKYVCSQDPRLDKGRNCHRRETKRNRTICFYSKGFHCLCLGGSLSFLFFSSHEPPNGNKDTNVPAHFELNIPWANSCRAFCCRPQLPKVPDHVSLAAKEPSKCLKQTQCHMTRGSTKPVGKVYTGLAITAK